MGKYMRRLSSFLVLLALGGCATLPSGPSVRVLPGPSKTFAEFQSDNAICRQWAGQQIGMSPQDTANQNTATGAVLGTAAGTLLGAAIGSTSGNAGEGAAIGAGTGLLLGSAQGASAGQYYGAEAQRRYDIAYEQCMYARGHQIPGVVQWTGPVRKAAPPPPPPPDMRSVPPDYNPSYPPPPLSQ